MKRKVKYLFEYTTNKTKNTENTSVFGPYLKAVIYYGGTGLFTCVYIGKRFVFPTFQLENGRWKKLMREANVG